RRQHVWQPSGGSTAMTVSNQRGSDTNTREELRHSLHILDGISTWHLWSGAVMFLLLPGMIALLSLPLLPAELSLFQKIDAGLFVRGLLGVIWVASGFTLFRQRRRLKLLRKDLIEQMDAATKNRVRGEQFYGM